MAKSSDSITCSSCGIELNKETQSEAIAKSRRKLCTKCETKRKSAYKDRYAIKKNAKATESRRLKALTRVKPTPMERMSKFINRKEEHECWPWVGAINKQTGYGAFSLNGKPVTAHRAMVLLTSGSDPGNLIVRHKCDNKVCVNPSHLELGTQADNMQDAVKRNRICSGDMRVHAALSAKRVALRRLTESQALEIFNMVKSGETRSIVAGKFGVTKSNVDKIMIGDTWGHVTGMQCKRHSWKTKKALTQKGST